MTSAASVTPDLSKGITAAAAAGDIHDIRLPEPGDTWPPFTLTAGVLAVAAVVLLTRRLRNTADRETSQLSLSSPRQAPAGADRLAQLAREFRQGSCSAGQAIVRLDEILRTGIVEHGTVPAMRLTSAELAAMVGTIFGDTAHTLVHLLHLIDRVKFGCCIPANAEVEQSLDDATEVLAALKKRQAV